MRESTIGFGLIVILVLAVAFAGCSGTSTAPSTPPGGQAAAGGTQQGATGGASSGLLGGDQLFGGVSYNWVEYKTTSGAGGQQMIIYTKWTKEGKCTMRFEGAGAEQMKGMMPTEMDCSSTGGGQGQQQSNPNQASPDIKFVKVGTEMVTVPAGTFTADKYTATYQGMTSTYWIAGGKPLLKMEGGSGQSQTVMELNGWG
jgi:hypothetical protein